MLRIMSHLTPLDTLDGHTTSWVFRPAELDPMLGSAVAVLDESEGRVYVYYDAGATAHDLAETLPQLLGALSKRLLSLPR